MKYLLIGYPHGRKDQSVVKVTCVLQSTLFLANKGRALFSKQAPNSKVCHRY